MQINMDWNSLKSLSLTARLGSISAAARYLGVNYTTIFRRLESLERSVGGKLFERGSKGYVPTPLAEELLVYSDNMLVGAEKIDRLIVGKEFQPRGKVRITAPFNIANNFLPSALASLKENYPDIVLEVLSSNDAFNLNSRAADIAIRATLSPPDHLIGRKAASIPWAMYASEDLLLKYENVPSINSLEDYPLIGGTGMMMSLPAFAWLQSRHKESITVRCDELTAMSNFATAGYGVAFLPVDQRRKELIEIDYFEPGHMSDLWVLTHPDLRKTERIKVVVEQLVTYFRSYEFSPHIFSQSIKD